MSWETSNEHGISDISVVHHIIEAMELGARGLMNDDPEYKKVAEESETIGEVLDYYMKKGDQVMVGSIVCHEMLDEIHEIVHDVMSGKGISDLSNKNIKKMAMDWYGSDMFKDKYERIIKNYGEDFVKKELGIK